MTHPTWPDAPFSVQQLAERPTPPSTPHAPSRLLLPLLGPLVTAAELYNADAHDELDVVNLELVRAHTLKPLIGARLNVTSADDIANEVARVLAEQIPGFDWHVPKDWAGPYERYGIAHKSLPAPPHPETGEAMAIELFGVREAPGAVVISAATYANLQYPGYGVDLYL